MNNKLTRKEKNFVKEYVKTGNGVQSALKSYDTESYKTASTIADANLDKPRVILAIAERLPDDLLEEKHLALLNKRDATGEIDAMAVSKGLDMAYKVKGSYAPDKNININMSVKSIDPTDETILNSLKAIQDKLENAETQ